MHVGRRAARRAAPWPSPACANARPVVTEVASGISALGLRVNAAAGNVDPGRADGLAADTAAASSGSTGGPTSPTPSSTVHRLRRDACQGAAARTRKAAMAAIWAAVWVRKS
jgi:hypothetical protein